MKHKDGVLGVYNYYILNTTYAFSDKAFGEDRFLYLLDHSADYPAYVLVDSASGDIIGFTKLGEYLSYDTFKGAAYVTYYLMPGYTGIGLGKKCLDVLTEDARKLGIRNLIADVSSENTGSIAFHKKHGFRFVGEIKNAGFKLGRSFGAVYFHKEI